MSTKVALCLVTLLSVGVAVGQSQDSKKRTAMERFERLARIQMRAEQIPPRRRESPIREDNITDKEVEEIQSVMAQVQPGSIVNIGTVVTGCPCEDGLKCSAQVWVVANRPKVSVGLLLSRIDGRWMIGPVQQWWLDSASLEARRDSYDPIYAFFEAEDALLERFPACAYKKADPEDAHRSK